MGRWDKKIAYSPRYTVCRNCGKKYKYNYYNRNFDTSSYCPSCLKGGKKKKKPVDDDGMLHMGYE